MRIPPGPHIFALYALLAFATYLGVRQYTRANRLERENAALVQKNEQLTRERERAHSLADSLTRRTHAQRETIKAVSAAVPDAVRTDLNRRLLSELQP